MERHEGASQAYETAGLQILELAQSAYSSYVTKIHAKGVSRENRCIEQVAFQARRTSTRVNTFS